MKKTFLKKTRFISRIIFRSGKYSICMILRKTERRSESVSEQTIFYDRERMNDSSKKMMSNSDDAVYQKAVEILEKLASDERKKGFSLNDKIVAEYNSFFCEHLSKMGNPPYSKEALEQFLASLRKLQIRLRRCSLKEYVDGENLSEQKLVEIIRVIFEIGVICRREGVLAVEDFLELKEDKLFFEPENSFAVTLVKAMINMQSTSRIESLAGELLSEQGLSFDANDASCLSYRIIKEGIVSVQTGDELDTTAERMLRLVSEDTWEKYEPCLDEWKKVGAVRLKELRETTDDCVRS